MIADLGMRSASSGLISWSWDGLDASGNQVVDGEYLVQITLHDDCGHELVRWVPFYLDNHAPDITWIQPEPGESVDLFQPVRAALLDANPLTADLHYRALVGSANWEVIREGSTTALIRRFSLIRWPCGTRMFRRVHINFVWLLAIKWAMFLNRQSKCKCQSGNPCLPLLIWRRT